MCVCVRGRKSTLPAERAAAILGEVDALWFLLCLSLETCLYQPACPKCFILEVCDFSLFTHSSGTYTSCKFQLLFSPLESPPNWPIHHTAAPQIHWIASRQFLVLQCQSKNSQSVHHQLGNRERNSYLNTGL